MEECPLGFVTENGEFIQADWGEHTQFALELLPRLGYDVDDIIDKDIDPVDILIENHGWILIHFSTHISVDVEYCGLLTEEQDSFLEKYAEQYHTLIHLHHIKYIHYYEK